MRPRAAWTCRTEETVANLRRSARASPARVSREAAYTSRSGPEGVRPQQGEGRRESGGLQEEGRSGRDLRLRQLPQHMNEEEFVHGGSAFAKLSVQRVDVHGCTFAGAAPLG